jgi:hypothetical protein
VHRDGFLNRLAPTASKEESVMQHRILILLGAAAVLAGGCLPQNQASSASVYSGLGKRQCETRWIRASQKQTLESALNILMDDGFLVDAYDVESGRIVALRQGSSPYFSRGTLAEVTRCEVVVRAGDAPNQSQIRVSWHLKVDPARRQAYTVPKQPTEMNLRFFALLAREFVLSDQPRTEYASAGSATPLALANPARTPVKPEPANPPASAAQAKTDLRPAIEVEPENTLAFPRPVTVHVKPGMTLLYRR